MIVKEIADAEAATPDDGLPLGDAPPDRLLRLLHWTSNASRNLRRRLTDITSALDLSDTELIVVWMCSGEGRVQIDLAGSTGISPAQMSGLVERLRSRGLVAMHRQAGDRRRQIWRATAAGQALLVTAGRHLSELADGLGEHLNPEEQLLTQSLCQRLAEAAADGGRTASKTTTAAHESPQSFTKEAA
jgi:DNA-binding MarR family transcriptional regulator